MKFSWSRSNEPYFQANVLQGGSLIQSLALMVKGKYKTAQKTIFLNRNFSESTQYFFSFFFVKCFRTFYFLCNLICKLILQFCLTDGFRRYEKNILVFFQNDWNLLSRMISAQKAPIVSKSNQCDLKKKVFLEYSLILVLN